MSNEASERELAALAKADTWIFRFWMKIFQQLRKFSIFNLIRAIFPRLKYNYSFVDYYVTFFTIISIISLIIATHNRDKTVTYLLIFASIIGFLRISEMFVYQVNVLLFDEPAANNVGLKYAVKGYKRILILLAHNFIEIICWFGVLQMWAFRSEAIKIEGKNLDQIIENRTFFKVLRESILTMFAYNPDHTKTETDFGAALFSAQAIIGVFMTIMVIARFLSALPPPMSLDISDGRYPLAQDETKSRIQE